MDSMQVKVIVGILAVISGLLAVSALGTLLRARSRGSRGVYLVIMAILATCYTLLVRAVWIL